ETTRRNSMVHSTTRPMPQESQTANLISRHNAGILLSRAGDIAPIIRRLSHNPAEHAAMRAAASRIAIPDATKRIVDELMRKLGERVSVQPPEIESAEYQVPA